MKCQTPAKKESKTWANYTPTNSRSCRDWYYCDHESGDYPLRDVSGQGKPEPHYEDGTFNACTSCNQKCLKKALENGERYIFFFTKYVGRDKDLREKFGKKYWLPINNTFVMYGQNICKPISPMCTVCKIRNSCNYFKTKNA